VRRTEPALEDPTFKAFEFRRQIHKSLIQKIFLALGRKGEGEPRPPARRESPPTRADR